MNCSEAQDRLLEAMLEPAQLGTETSRHLGECAACAAMWARLTETSALLGEWQSPEVSPFYDTRFQARLAEVKRQEAERATGLLGWVKRMPVWRPVAAAALTVAMVVGVSVYSTEQNHGAGTNPSLATVKGTAVDDLQRLERKEDLYSEVDLLDDMNSAQQQGQQNQQTQDTL